MHDVGTYPDLWSGALTGVVIGKIEKAHKSTVSPLSTKIHRNQPSQSFLFMPVPVLVLQYRYCKQSCGSDTETMGHGSGDWCALCRGCRDLHVGVRRLYQGACPDSLSMTDDPETRLRPGVLSSMTRCLILGCAAYKCCLCVALIRAMQLAWNVMAGMG